MSTVEKKRAEAQGYRGVTYDRRIDKFTAKITLFGRTHHLGSFVTADEAGAAYEEQRSAVPITRCHDGKASFPITYSEFFTSCKKDERGAVAVGEIFTAPDGQRFRLMAVEYARKGGKTYVWSIWNSRCRMCGATYSFSINRSIRRVLSMLRTCPLHRGESHIETKSWPDPESWSAPALIASKPAVEAKDPLLMDRKERWEFFRDKFYAEGGKEEDLGHAFHLFLQELGLVPREGDDLI